MWNKDKSKDKRRVRGDPYWEYEMTQILSEFGAMALPDLTCPDEDSGKELELATRVPLKYVVRRVHALQKEDLGPKLDEMVHDFLDQARIQTTGAYWRELHQEYRKRGMFML